MRIAAATLTVLCLASAASAQSAAPALPEPAKAATPAANPWTFSSDAGMMIIFIKPDKVVDFETILARAKDALVKSDKPERRQQAAGWRIFKARESGPGATTIYVSLMDPVVKDSDYSIGSLLTEASYAKYLEVFGSPAVNLLHLSRIP